MRRIGRRAFFGAGAFTATGAVAAPASWLWATRVEPRRIEVNRLRLPLAGLPSAFAGVRIAQISDLHYSEIVSPDLIRRAIDLVLAERPDLIVVTGDFVSTLRNGEAALVERDLARLRAPLGQFAILGNHDHWTNADAVATAVQRAGLDVLRNVARPLSIGGQVLHLVGLDDIWLLKHDPEGALRSVPTNGRVILLAHEPDFADQAATDRRIMLQLSGHSHGGQFRLPGIGPLVTPPFAEKYRDGTYRVQQMHLHVNRGIGTTGRAFRFNCPPEVTVLELTAAG